MFERRCHVEVFPAAVTRGKHNQGGALERVDIVVEIGIVVEQGIDWVRYKVDISAGVLR